MLYHTMMSEKAPIQQKSEAHFSHGMQMFLISLSLHQKVWQLLTHSQREEEKEWEETQARQVSVYKL